MKTRSHLLGCLLCASAALPATAQTEIGFAAGFGTLQGGDFAGESGPAVGVGLYFPVLDDFQGGVSLEHSSYRGRGLEGDTSQRDYLAVVRYVGAYGRVRLYAGGKMGLSRRSLTVAEVPASTQGFVVGPTAGLQVLIGNVALELSGDGLYYTYEEIIRYARREHGTDKDGLRLVIRSGFAITVGRR